VMVVVQLQAAFSEVVPRSVLAVPRERDAHLSKGCTRGRQVLAACTDILVRVLRFTTLAVLPLWPLSTHALCDLYDAL
jgi:hypothetical protein